MKIGIFSPYSLPDLGACSMRMDSFKKYFERNGHKVKIYSPRRNSPKNMLENNYRYDSIREAMQKVREFDVIIATGPPLTHSFLVLLSAKIYGIPVIIDIRDPWTYATEGLGIYKRSNLKLWLYKAIEFFSYNLADRIFTVTETISKIVEKKTFNKSKIKLISNGTTPSLFLRNGKEGKIVREKFSIPEDARIGIYAGAFIKKDVDIMLKELKELLDAEKFYILMVIPGKKSERVEYNKLITLTKKLKISKKVKFVNSSEFGFGELYKYYSAADFGLNPLPLGMRDYCIPVKTYDFFACGLPVLAKGDKKSSLEQIIVSNKLGYFADNWSDFRENAKTMITMDLKKMSNHAQNSAAEKFDRKFSNIKALKILNELVKGGQ